MKRFAALASEYRLPAGDPNEEEPDQKLAALCVHNAVKAEEHGAHVVARVWRLVSMLFAVVSAEEPRLDESVSGLQALLDTPREVEMNAEEKDEFEGGVQLYAPSEAKAAPEYLQDGFPRKTSVALSGESRAE